MPLAALAVHQLRYILAFGGQANEELREQGHAYLSSFTPSIIVLCAVAFGCFLARLGRSWQRPEREHRPAHPLVRLWLVAAIGLLAIYVGQETLEGFFATGHPSGLVGVFGDGGLWSVPAALLVGAVLAFALRAADATVRFVSRIASRRGAQVPSRAPRATSRPEAVVVPCAVPLACSRGGRAPPLHAFAL
jgi:hypothetical protein